MPSEKHPADHPGPVPRRRILPCAAVLVAQAVLLAACNTEAPPDRETVVTDSAGVRIVENAGSAAGTTDPAAKLAIQDLRIGMRDGPEDYQFAGIRGAARLDDDALVVLNATPPEVRVFGPDGQIERVFGSPGEGPGEFRSVDALQVLPGDTIVVYDRSARRFTRFDREGLFIRTTAIENPASGVIGFLDPHTVISERPTVTMIAGQPMEEPQIRTSVVLERVDLTSETVDSIEVFGGRERYRSVTDQGGVPRMTIFSVPFTVDGRALVRGGRLYLTDGQRPEIRVRDFDGDLETVIRFGGAPRPVRDEDVDRWVEERLSRWRGSADRAEMQAAYRDMNMPATMPWFDEMVVNERGDIWAREYDPFPGDLRTWTTVDAEGRQVGRASLPADLEVLYSDTEIVLGVVRDELDVEYLVRLQLDG